MISEITTLQRLDALLRSGRAGGKTQLAKKFNVSERTISRWIEYMNTFGSEIYYCRTRMSYRYRAEGRFVVLVEFQPKDELNKQSAE